MEAIEEMELTSIAHPPTAFEVLRVPFLLEFGYAEDVLFCETYTQRMKRKFSGDKDFEAFNVG